MFSILIFSALLQCILSAEILISPSGLFPVHRFTMRHLAEELVKRGHTVTWFEIGLEKVHFYSILIYQFFFSPISRFPKKLMRFILKRIHPIRS